MRYSQVFPKTRKEDPRDSASPGTRLLVRGGFFSQLAGGIWINNPLGLRVRRNVERVVRQEMNRAGAVELELPILHPRELWDETGRWEKYCQAQIAFTLKDRRGGGFILAPTAEEPITDFARRYLPSYKDLPVIFWQMGPKYRDELRPRQGLIRGREFVMKDAYSFDADEAGMRASFAFMEEAYRRIFTRLGFKFIQVEADSGAIGGSGSSEFMATTEFGEDTILHCPHCHYGGNQEKAKSHYPNYPEEAEAGLTRLETPNIRTVEELEEFVGLPSCKMVKTIVLEADGQPVIVSMRGDLEISEVKLANFLGATEVQTAEASIVVEVTGAPVGFAGPIDLFGKTKVRYLFDSSVKGLKNFLCGANQKDIHYINVNSGRDFSMPEEFHDLARAVAGLHCSSCRQGQFEMMRGIELGHIFQLQQSYSLPMQATFLNQEGKLVPFWMGCYGIGVSRIVQAIVEQNNDERGIIWPIMVAPFQVVVIPVNVQDNLQAAEEIYSHILGQDLDVLLDDRPARIGEKLTDAELLGFPVQVIVGRSWQKSGKLEVKLRNPELSGVVDFAFNQPKPDSLPVAELELEATVSLIKSLMKI